MALCRRSRSIGIRMSAISLKKHIGIMSYGQSGTVRQLNSAETKDMRREMRDLKKMFAELSIENRPLEKA